MLFLRIKSMECGRGAMMKLMVISCGLNAEETDWEVGCRFECLFRLSGESGFSANSSPGKASLMSSSSLKSIHRQWP